MSGSERRIFFSALNANENAVGAATQSAMHTTTSASDWVFAVNSWIAANALLIVTGTALLYLVLFYPACDGMAAAGVALLLVAMYCLMQASSRLPVEMYYAGNDVSCGTVAVTSKGTSGTNNTITISGLPDGSSKTIPGLIKVSQGVEIAPLPTNDTTVAYKLTKVGLKMQECIYYGAQDGFTAGNFTCNSVSGETSCTKFKFLRKAYGGTPKWNQIPKLMTTKLSTGSTAFFLPVIPQQFLGSQKVASASDGSKISLILVNGDRLYVFRSEATFSVAVNANSVYLKNNQGEQSPPLGSGVTTLTGDGSGNVTISKTSSGGVKSTEPLANTFMPKINDCVAVMYYKSNNATEPGRFQIVGDSKTVMTAANMPTHTKALVLPMYGWDAKVTYKTSSATSAASIPVDVKSRDLNNGKQGQRTYAGLSGGTFKYGITGITFAKAGAVGGGTPTNTSSTSVVDQSTPNGAQGNEGIQTGNVTPNGPQGYWSSDGWHEGIQTGNVNNTGVTSSLTYSDTTPSTSTFPDPTTISVKNKLTIITTSLAHEAHLFNTKFSPDKIAPHTVIGPGGVIRISNNEFGQITHVVFVAISTESAYRKHVYIKSSNKYVLNKLTETMSCGRYLGYGSNGIVDGVCIYNINDEYVNGPIPVSKVDNPYPTVAGTMNVVTTVNRNTITTTAEQNVKVDTSGSSTGVGIFNRTNYYANVMSDKNPSVICMEIAPNSFGYTMFKQKEVKLFQQL